MDQRESPGGGDLLSYTFDLLTCSPSLLLAFSCCRRLLPVATLSAPSDPDGRAPTPWSWEILMNETFHENCERSFWKRRALEMIPPADKL